MTVGLTYPPHPRKASIISTSDRRGSTSSVYRCFQNYYHGHKYLNPDPLYIANVRLSINHWQIRDLVQVDAFTGSIFHTEDENIRVISMKNRSLDGPIRSRNHLSLPYRPRCFHHAAGGLVVAGGVLTSSAKAYSMNLQNLTSNYQGGCYLKQAKGVFSIYSPGMGEEMSFQLGDMINNAVTIYPQQNSTASYTSYVCNNDTSLYTVDISDSGITGDRKMVCEEHTSLNNVHKPPNSKTLTVTGDSGTIYIVDPLSPDPVIQKITSTHDSGFGVSYHNNGQVFAAAFQDGTCSLYDIRNTNKPIHEVISTRPGHQSGAFRTCRFSSSSMQDLLVVSEHLGRVHLIDVRNLFQENHQVVVFPFALDQYARYKQSAQQVGDDFVTDVHRAVDVYCDEAAHFTAPLVYDYEYLTDVNPKLFKGFSYEPQHSSVPEEEFESETVPEISPESGCVSDIPMPLAGVFMDEDVHLEHTRRSYEVYQQAGNHVNGEMEIAGLDWHENKLYIGCEDGGILVLDVNVRARRSFGSFSYI